MAAGATGGKFDLPAALICALALLALVRLRLGVIPVIAGSAVLGLAVRLA